MKVAAVIGEKNGDKVVLFFMCLLVIAEKFEAIRRKKEINLGFVL
jgi:hypothetical protein